MADDAKKGGGGMTVERLFTMPMFMLGLVIWFVSRHPIGSADFLAATARGLIDLFAAFAERV